MQTLRTLLTGLFMAIASISIAQVTVSTSQLNGTKWKIKGDNMGGGALLITSDAFIRAGKEDERFYGWGYEDWNRLFHPIK